MNTALADFKASVQRIRDVTDDAINRTSEILKDAALRQRYETVLSAVVVTMSGYLEAFLRDVAAEYADAICRQAQPFTNLKSEIQATHLYGGGKFLHQFGTKTASARYSWTTTTPEDLVRRLASVHAAAATYELVWEAFAETNGNPNSQIIGEFLKRFGVKDPIPTLAGQMTNMTDTAFSSQLNSFISIRNECAHTGYTNQPLTAVSVRDYCAFFENIGEGIVKTLTSHHIC